MVTGEASRGHRERKKQQTRTALSWAVIRLSVERGWDNVTIDDVAAEAGVTGRTFRNYFSSKGEAVVARHLDRMLGVADELRSRPADEELDQAILQSVRSQFRSDDTSPDDVRMDAAEWAGGVRLMLSEAEVRGEMLKANARSASALAAAIAERLGTDPDTDYYPSLAASASHAAITVALDHWLRRGDRQSVDALLVEVLNRLWSGLPVR